MLDYISAFVISASVVAAVLGCLFLALARFARDDRPYESSLYEPLRQWLAPMRDMLIFVGGAFFLLLGLFVAYLLLGR